MENQDADSNFFCQQSTIDPILRASIKKQIPLCIWMTGLSGAGKSTLANLLENALHHKKLHTMLLDGDNLRRGLCADLGFTHIDRTENIRRVAEVCRLMVDAGLIVIAAFISPREAQRAFARSLFSEQQFIEVFVDAPIEECEKRDPKGLYKKFRAGRLKALTGIDDIYEPPKNPELHIKTNVDCPDVCLHKILNLIESRQK